MSGPSGRDVWNLFGIAIPIAASRDDVEARGK